MSFVGRTLQDIEDYFPSASMSPQELKAYEARQHQRTMHPTHFQEYWPIYVLACPLFLVFALGALADLVLTLNG